MDETDEYVDVHKRYCLIFRGTTCYKLHSSTSAEFIICTKMNYLPYRIRVAAAAAASSVARAPSVRRLTAQKASVSAIFYLPCVEVLMGVLSSLVHLLSFRYEYMCL